MTLESKELPSAADDRLSLTPTQQREREFYNRYSQLHWNDPACFDPILGRERRPWNSYWEVFRIVQQRYEPGMRLLDFGCGWGAFSVVFAKIGFQVDGFDLSEGNLLVAHERAARYDMSSQIALTRSPAEDLPYSDESFDVIAGIDILHHVDIPSAIEECYRVLKPGGLAVFREPIRNVVFDAVRNSWPVRRMLSNDYSLDRHITHDEEKLRPSDLAEIRRVFPAMKQNRFQVISRLAALWKPSEYYLERVDHTLRFIPGYRRFAGSVVLELPKK